MNWRQQKLDDLRGAIAALLEHRALATDIDTIRRLDGQISEHCTVVADLERSLKVAS
jgi:hypothetical protein